MSCARTKCMLFPGATRLVTVRKFNGCTSRLYTTFHFHAALFGTRSRPGGNARDGGGLRGLHQQKTGASYWFYRAQPTSTPPGVGASGLADAASAGMDQSRIGL